MDFIQRRERDFMLEEAEAIAQKAKDEHRQLTDVEIAETDKLIDDAEAIAGGAPGTADRQTTSNEIGSIGACGFDAPAKAKPKLETWKSARGKAVTVLGRDDKFSDLPASEGFEGIDPSEYSLGGLIVGSLTGNWSGPEERFAMGGAIQSAGGALIPEPLSRQFIDAARASPHIA